MTDSSIDPSNTPSPIRSVSNGTAGSGIRRMNSNFPAQKVTASAAAAAIVQLLIYVNSSRGGPPIPAEVSASLTVIVTFAVGWLVPPGSKEQAIELVDPREKSPNPVG